MEILLLLVLIIFIAIFGIFLFLLYQKVNQLSVGGDTQQTFQVMAKWMEQMQHRLDRNADVLERGLRQTHEQVASRLDKTGEMLGVVGERIGEMSEIGRSMRDIGDLLKSPKLRGNIGEFVLKDLLKQHLPQSSFALQYPFSNGSIVDAVIRTEQGILCIDSKFPFENFKKMYGAQSDQEREVFRREFIRDVKKHIDAISSKYIVPEEKSLDYALMYVPSESIYYEIMCHYDELLNYAHAKQVVVVSPSVFYAYLRVILLSLEGRKVEEQARDLMRSFRGLEQEFHRFGDQFQLGVKHLTNARNAFDDASIRYQTMEGKMQGFLRIEDGISNSDTS